MLQIRANPLATPRARGTYQVRRSPRMEQPFLELLARRSLPKLAAAVRAAYPAIETRWIAAIRETLESTQGMTLGQLRDDLPQVMEQVAHSIESERPEAVRRLSSITEL